MEKNKKVLFVATVDSHILAFHLPYLKNFKELGYEVHVATNSDVEIPYCDKKHKISIERNPFKLNNIKAIKQLKKIINDEKFCLIHCHTPMGSVIARLANKKNTESKLIYTAHGFHFYKGAPILNWILFYPIEKYLSKYTDVLITINDEDYKLAKEKFKAKHIYLVNGVGINENRFSKQISEQKKEQLYNEIGIDEEDCVILYVAELSKRKNQQMLIETIKEVRKEVKNIKLLLVGDGQLYDFYRKIIDEQNLINNVKLLGFRTDVEDLMKICNIYVSTSTQEGLPVNIMEAMASSLPIIATNCRGNNDLIRNQENGYLIEIGDKENLKEKIIYIYNNYDNEKEKAQKNNYSLIQKYLLDNVMEEMKEIYSRCLNGED